MKEELLFCPLGGSGEIGMNMNLFAFGKPDDQKWIIVDIGVTFADDSVPGIDLIYPDPGFIISKKENLLGIVLTHAHEDHIGAIAHIWPKLNCKIYATRFTAILIKEKFKEKKIDIDDKLIIVELNGTVNLDPFIIEYITLTHSILEPNGLRIKTPHGIILHTGDWKVDSNPLIGDKINSKRLIEIGKEGVLAMICDSTNVFSIGRSGSEGDVRKSLYKIMSRLKNKIEFEPIILPKKTIFQLCSILEDTDGDIKISNIKSKIKFEINESILISKLIDGKFPNYVQVIPKENQKKTRNRSKIIFKLC